MANKQTIIGKTAPVPLGQQKAVNSLPVVFAEDQPPIPVEEQNKIQSEVALRSEERRVGKECRL